MRRTTLRLDGPLLSEAKRIAAESGTTLTAVIENALRESLARRRRVRVSSKVAFTTYGGRGPRPGVDLDNTAALLEWMESGDGAR